MTMEFYYGSGSPYAWRVWLALEHKRAPYELKLLSFSAGDLEKPAFVALNPRHKVPVIVDDGFALYESAAILEYLEERYPDPAARLFPSDLRRRAVARRLVRESDQYLAAALETLVQEVLFTAPEDFDEHAIAAGRGAFAAELAHFERDAASEGFFLGAAGAVDFTLYPMIALALRCERKKPDLGVQAIIPPKLAAWTRRVEQLPYFATTYPPHWKQV